MRAIRTMREMRDMRESITMGELRGLVRDETVKEMIMVREMSG